MGHIEESYDKSIPNISDKVIELVKKPVLNLKKLKKNKGYSSN